MSLYLFYILIILVIAILFFLVKDKKELISKLGITGIISGISLIVVGLVLNILFHTFLNNFNITKISSLIFNKFFYTSIFFFSIGLIMLVISKLINRGSKKVSSNS